MEEVLFRKWLDEQLGNPPAAPLNEYALILERIRTSESKKMPSRFQAWLTPVYYGFAAACLYFSVIPPHIDMPAQNAYAVSFLNSDLEPSAKLVYNLISSTKAP